mmetsp:Transcript_34374/g.95025  ORF Transcript_34374/g.95025 Transcript_34374/m.95025 type:complete len:918 (-) Transcript_34374:183-2936(-)
MSPSALSQPWLYGALLSVVASSLGIAGFILQKAAEHQVAHNGVHPAGIRLPRVQWCELLRSRAWWFGLSLMIVRHSINLLVLTFTPETTVIPLGAVEIALNVILAYGLLDERFTGTDMRGSTACIVGTVVVFTSLPHSVPGYVTNFPVAQLAEFWGSLFSNIGFALYLLLWFALLALCVYVVLNVSQTGELKPFVLPLLVGLFTSQFHFVVKLLVTLVNSGEHPQAWELSANLVIAATAALAVSAIGASCEGLRQLDCRFFVPASFSATTVMIALQDLLFFSEWQLMSSFDLVCFVCGCIVSVVGAVSVSPGHNRAVPRKGSNRVPLLAIDHNETLHQFQPSLLVMEEHKIIRPQPARACPLEVFDLNTPTQGFWAFLRLIWKWMPIAACMGVLVMCAVLYIGDYMFVIFSILTAWGVHNGWKYGLHMALFSYVGQRKMAQYEKCDFYALHQLQRELGASDAETAGPEWGAVRHFVLLPNYKEDVDILRLAIGSIAASPIAASQICVVLAMEGREAGAEAKAQSLQQEFAGKFWRMVATYHPSNIPGEIPGKSSNVKWAASQVLDYEVPRAGLDLDNVVMTVADADSEFHTRYFEALTYQFVHAGCGEGETPERYLSIWQPPIIHYKNYLTQPVIVRLASLFTSQHELANLADPSATKVPYSTYSISAALAKAVQGWDPDWISEDWHMGIKCFLATAGRLRIQPIFLGVMNYAPEGESYEETIRARWTQAKRHALGFSEIVFFQDHFPRVLFSIQGGWQRAVFVWRSFFLWSRCLLIHLTMATMLAIGPFTALIIAHFLKHQILEDVNSWTFLTYCIFQSTGGISVMLFMFTNVLLYELTRSRIDAGGEPWLSALVANRWMHFLWVTTTSMAFMPFFFFAGGMAEWIAAVKTARTHKFKYEVALKPSLSQQHSNIGD